METKSSQESSSSRVNSPRNILIDSGTLRLSNCCLDFEKILGLLKRIKSNKEQRFTSSSPSINAIELNSCIILDEEKDHHQLMAALHNVIAEAEDLERVSFENSMITGRVFFRGRAAKVHPSEQVSIEGFTSDDIPIVRDDDPPVRVDHDDRSYYYIKTTVFKGEFRRYYIILNWLKKLKYIQMSKTPISGYGVSALCGATCDHLTTLRLAECRNLDDRALHSIVELLRVLEHLDISGCPQISKYALLHLGDMHADVVKRLKIIKVTGTGTDHEQKQLYNEKNGDDANHFTAMPYSPYHSQHNLYHREQQNYHHEKRYEVYPNPRHILHLSLLRCLRSKGFRGKFECDGKHCSQESKENKNNAINDGCEPDNLHPEPNQEIQKSLKWLDLLSTESIPADNYNVKVNQKTELSVEEFLKGSVVADTTKSSSLSFPQQLQSSRDISSKRSATDFWRELKLRHIFEDYQSGVDNIKIIDLAQRDITAISMRALTRASVSSVPTPGSPEQLLKSSSTLSQSTTIFSNTSRRRQLQSPSPWILKSTIAPLELNLAGKLVNDEILGFLLKAIGGRLEALDLSRTMITEYGLAHLVHCPGLRRLKLNYLRSVSTKQRANRILMPCIAKMQKLEELGIDGSRISGRALSLHTQLCLQRFSACQCPISKHALILLQETCGTVLKSLFLDRCNYINKECIEILGLFPRLQILSITHCKGLNGDDILSFQTAKWQDMKCIDVRGIKGLTYKTVDFLKNKFWGNHLNVKIVWLDRPQNDVKTKTEIGGTFLHHTQRVKDDNENQRRSHQGRFLGPTPLDNWPYIPIQRLNPKGREKEDRDRGNRNSVDTDNKFSKILQQSNPPRPFADANSQGKIHPKLSDEDSGGGQYVTVSNADFVTRRPTEKTPTRSKVHSYSSMRAADFLVEKHGDAKAT